MLTSKSEQIIDPIATVRTAALNAKHVAGYTHKFYRYPARFSPAFARGCIEALSRPGDVILDPYMGGGTTIVESMLLGRRAIGTDVNSLALFIARVKVTGLSESEQKALMQWASTAVPTLRCTMRLDPDMRWTPRNMGLPSARWIRKQIALCLVAAQEELPSSASLDFAKCVLLNVGQWALNGKRSPTSAQEFRDRIPVTTEEMLNGASDLFAELKNGAGTVFEPLLQHSDAEFMHLNEQIRAAGPADLVVTSPPYPGIHMLYHRWQVDGRKETDAPYWIAGCSDGAGAAYYNFASRHRQAEDMYFQKAERSFSSIRSVMRNGATLVQMVAFSEPQRQLARYLNMMQRSGFEEIHESGQGRIWRCVPGRRWHAHSKGNLSSSREVVLLHRTT